MVECAETNYTPASGPSAQFAGLTTADDSEHHVPSRKQRRPQKNSKIHTDGTLSESAVAPTPSSRAKKNSQIKNQTLPIPINSSGKKQKATSSTTHAMPATPAKEQAYAGSTFQASPAPSSLPLPKLFSRPVSGQSTLTSPRPESARAVELKSTSPQPEPTLSRSPAPENVYQSPLDVLFQADRAQKGSSRAQFSPMATRLVPSDRPDSAMSADLSDLDARPVLSKQASSNTHHTRPSFSRSSTQPDSIRDSFPTAHAVNTTPKHSEDMTKSLKEFLFNSTSAQLPPSPSAAPSPLRPKSAATHHSPSPYTPRYTSGQPNDAYMHYGNRNLSPMFQAARGGAHSTPINNENINPNGPPTSPTPTGVTNLMDTNVFSRNYLNQHIYDSSPKPSTYADAYDNSLYSKLYSPQQTPLGYRRQDVLGHRQTPDRPPQTHPTPHPPSSDIRSMEDDLRRILNLSGMSK